MKLLGYLLLALPLACSSGGSNNDSFGVERKEASAGYEMDDILEETVAIDASNSPNVAQQEQKIIKTANLRYEADDLNATHQKIIALATQLNGFVGTDNSGKNYNEFYRNVTVRVPTENFQTFIDEVSKGVNYFDQKDISRRDVTEEFVDLNARLKAKRELENRYLELLKQAKTVKEMLEIERELSQIREEIEAKQGRLNYLSSQVSLSTIYIQVYKRTTQTGVTVSYGQKMKNALQGGWDGISVFFLVLLYLWPLFLVALIVILVIRRILKKKKK